MPGHIVYSGCQNPRIPTGNISARNGPKVLILYSELPSSPSAYSHRVPGMKTSTKRYLGDAFIITSWFLYVAAFLVLWAPLLPEWLDALAVLLALVAGYGVGSAWKRHVTGRTPVAARWLPDVA